MATSLISTIDVLIPEATLTIQIGCRTTQEIAALRQPS